MSRLDPFFTIPTPGRWLEWIRIGPESLHVVTWRLRRKSFLGRGYSFLSIGVHRWVHFGPFGGRGIAQCEVLGFFAGLGLTGSGRLVFVDVACQLPQLQP
jgi:hypothetical protein